MKKHTLTLLFILVVICLTKPSSGQNRKTDSLISLIKTDKEDTNKVNHLLFVGSDLMYNNPDTSIILGQQALTLAESLKFGNGQEGWKKGIATSLQNLGAYHERTADYPKSLNYYLRSLKIYEEMGNKKGMAFNLNNIGNIYHKQGDNSKALDYFFKSLKLKEELGNKRAIASTLSNIGLMYDQQGDYPKALNYYFKSLKLAEETESKSILEINLNNIADVYWVQGKHSKALEYYFKGLKMAEENGNKNSIATFLGNIGVAYTKMGSFKEAEPYLIKAIAIHEEVGAKLELNFFEGALSQLYDTIGQSKLALIHYKKSIAWKDSIFSAEKSKEISSMQMKYDTEKKEFELKLQEEKIETEHHRVEQVQYMGIVSIIILVIAFMFIASRAQLSLKVIDFAGFVGVLLFFQFIEALLHPTITHYTHGYPALFMLVNIAIASSIKPIHHIVEKRLITVSHTINEKRRLQILQKQEEERLRQEEAERLRREEEENTREE